MLVQPPPVRFCSCSCSLALWEACCSLQLLLFECSQTLWALVKVSFYKFKYQVKFFITHFGSLINTSFSEAKVINTFAKGARNGRRHPPELGRGVVVLLTSPRRAGARGFPTATGTQSLRRRKGCASVLESLARLRRVFCEKAKRGVWGVDPCEGRSRRWRLRWLAGWPG